MSPEEVTQGLERARALGIVYSYSMRTPYISPMLIRIYGSYEPSGTSTRPHATFLSRFILHDAAGSDLMVDRSGSGIETNGVTIL